MFFISGMLVAGGLAYTGTITYKYLQRVRRTQLSRSSATHVERVTTQIPDTPERTAALTRADRTVMVSSVALSATVVGLLFKSALIVASVPAALFIFTPTLKEAWHSLRHHRRITPSVLDATRVSLCIIMGYYFALALDTWLRSLAQRLFVRSEAELQDLLNRYFTAAPDAVWCYRSGADVQMPLEELAVGDILSLSMGELIPADGTILHGSAWIDELLVTGEAVAVQKATGDAVFASTVVQSGQIYVYVNAINGHSDAMAARDRLEAMPQASSYLIDAGTQSGRTMAPPMWTTFALLLPFWEANRAAGFLTTSFGQQMAQLGPYALRNFATFALQQNMLIYDGRVLESLNLVNTVILDAALMADEVIRAQAIETIATLRRRRWPVQEVTPHRFAIYLLSEGDEAATKALAEELGVDDYFVEPLASVRADLLERLQVGGRLSCYVGTRATDERVMEKALVSVVITSSQQRTSNSSQGFQHNAQQTDAAWLGATTAQVILLEKDLRKLELLFALARQFGVNQGINLAWPLLMDLVDITTTVFIHFGLTYSILFSYSGLLGGALQTRLPLARYLHQQAEAEETDIDPIPPSHQIAQTSSPANA